MIICDTGAVIFPTDRQTQAEDLMALAGDALIRGDALAWKVLYLASKELEQSPEHGTREARDINDAINRAYVGVRKVKV